MRRLLAALLACLWSLAAAAQDASLVADRLFVDAAGRLIASGTVQVFYQGTTLTASAVTYDRPAGRLVIEGPILIREASGQILAADSAELDPDLREGLLRGARLILDRQLQLAANRVDRLEGASALTGAAVTSCQVCPGRSPLWEITAAQVVHDEVARQIWFDRATFRVRGVPILWLPRLRLPAPDNPRASGLLIPRLRIDDRLGVGLQLPVFVALGPRRDITLTPYLAPGTRTLQLRYREALRRGDLTITGAVSSDSLMPRDPRGFLAAEGRFDLGPGATLAFSGTAPSDDRYLRDYGLFDRDRIESILRFEGAGERDLLIAEAVHVRSLRPGEADGELPPLLGSASWERRLPLRLGVLHLEGALDAFARTADIAGEAGRDRVRALAALGWRGDAVAGPGLLVAAEGRFALDAWHLGDDPAASPEGLRGRSAAAVTLRWPLVRHGAGGRSDLLEPVISLGWTGEAGDRPEPEDSLLPELDRGNLHALSRLPGEDGTEQGGRLSYGLAWTRTATDWAAMLAFGQVLRDDPMETAAASGLGGLSSDGLVEARFDWRGRAALGARALLGAEGFGQSEARIDWRLAAFDLSAAYVHLPPDADLGRADRAAEWTLDGVWRPTDRWTLRAGARYDLAADRPERASVGIGWRNECVEVDVSATRRYTTSEAMEPSTDFGLAVNLLGFSAGSRGARPGACPG